jgi:Domain of unknown function (DUF4249)
MKRFGIFLLLLASGSCIDRIEIAIPDGNVSQLVVDGVITDEPGPYTIKLSFSSRIDGFLQRSRPFTAKRVIIFDNAGNTEELGPIDAGVYQTKQDGIRGVVGREYSLRIETLDGKVYESIPDKMNPVGEVDSIYYEFNVFQPIDRPTEFGLTIFADAKGVPKSDNLFRWKFTGIFETNTNPELHRIPCGPAPCGCPDPRPCTFDIGGCSCCKCWATQHETQPHISDNQFVQGGIFKKISLEKIPLEYFSFQIKYRIEVRQMSLSRTAFDYWKTIQNQKEGAASLFQPPTGRARTNIFQKNGTNEVQGIFYASAVNKKQLYLTNKEIVKEWKRLEIPVLWCMVGIMPEDCRIAFPNSTTERPEDWK